MPKADYEKHTLVCPDRLLKNCDDSDEASNCEANDKVCESVTELYISERNNKSQTEPSDEDFFPLGVILGPQGAKYSRGRGICRRPKTFY